MVDRSIEQGGEPTLLAAKNGEALAPEAKRLRWAQAVIAGLLAASVIGFWVYVDLVNPAPFYTIKYDPEMAYLLNSLAPLTSHPYAYIDHPGTPVELIGTAILALLKGVTRLPSPQFESWILAHPEVFLQWGHGLLAVGSAFTIAWAVYAAHPVRDRLDLLASAGVAAAFFAVLPPDSFESLAFWSHNSFAFPAGTLLLLALAARLRKSDPIHGWEVCGLGVLVGVLTAVQLYFATWVLGVGVTLAVHSALQKRSAWRTAAIALALGGSALAGFIAGTLPILHRYREFTWWVRGLILHQGIFGRGPLGITSLSRMTANLDDLWSGGGQFVLIVTVLSLVLLGGSLRFSRGAAGRTSRWWALVAGMSFQIVATLALILKHPRVNYLLAVAAPLPIVLALILERRVGEGRWGRRLIGVLSSAVLIAFVASAGRSIADHHETLENVRRAEAEVQGFVEAYSLERGIGRENLILLWSFGTPSRCFALRFGNSYIDGIFTRVIDGLCAQEGVFDIFGGAIKYPPGAGDSQESQGWDVLIVSQSHAEGRILGLEPAWASSETGLAYYVR